MAMPTPLRRKLKKLRKLSASRRGQGQSVMLRVELACLRGCHDGKVTSASPMQAEPHEILRQAGRPDDKPRREWQRRANEAQGASAREYGQFRRAVEGYTRRTVPTAQDIGRWKLIHGKTPIRYL